MKTICGIDCINCAWQNSCKSCMATNGSPFGGECVVAQCFKTDGEKCFQAYKNQMIKEFNALKIADMPEIDNLIPLIGAYVNLEYTLPNNQKIKLLDDNKIYLGYQVEKSDSERCYGIVGDDNHLLVCEYG